MNYREQECTESRAFSDGTGKGTEWRYPSDSATGKEWPIDEQWCCRHYDERIIPEEEKAANEKAEQDRLDAQEAAIKQQAVTALLTSDIETNRSKELADKIAELTASTIQPITKQPLLKG
jgi:hypothetical protein